MGFVECILKLQYNVIVNMVSWDYVKGRREMKKITVSRDDFIYEAWPDVAMLKNGRMVCVFSECAHHGVRDDARIVIKTSDDNGETWSEKQYLTEKGKKDAFFNCARISNLQDGRLVIICDFIIGNENEKNTKNFLWFSEDGVNWSEPKELPLDGGIVPCFKELQSGRWLAAAHHPSKEGKLTEYYIYSDDRGETWSEKQILAEDPRYNLCEVSFLEIEPNVVVGYLRENSGQGYDCFKAISYDGGESWEGIYPVPLPGCHRPTVGFLKDGQILITYRFSQGGKGWLGNWTQNTFGAIMSKESALAKTRNNQAARIFPIDFDRSPKSDLGYTGWVQLENDDIYVVDYLVDDAPAAWIQASVISMDEIFLKEK